MLENNDLPKFPYAYKLIKLNNPNMAKRQVEILFYSMVNLLEFVIEKWIFIPDFHQVIIGVFQWKCTLCLE